ncbi:MAG: DUF3795 domain-containing protein [Anaerolineales bacterium]
MERMVAFCGLICTECPAYLATQTDDDAARARVVAQWTEAYGLEGLAVSDVNCDGCSARSRLSNFCYECPIRKCAEARALPNCAHCEDYEGCEHLNGFFTIAPEAKAFLDEIRAAI